MFIYRGYLLGSKRTKWRYRVRHCDLGVTPPWTHDLRRSPGCQYSSVNKGYDGIWFWYDSDMILIWWVTESQWVTWVCHGIGYWLPCLFLRSCHSPHTFDQCYPRLWIRWCRGKKHHLLRQQGAAQTKTQAGASHNAQAAVSQPNTKQHNYWESQEWGRIGWLSMKWTGRPNYINPKSK
jgi:hypothetical protein